ncbi:MAG TPA: hypothetical protein VGK74_03055 [Symbiobacteriaceae bacterium]
MGLLVLGIVGWLVPTVAGIWYLHTFREIRDEIRLIRRYLQLLSERPHAGDR